MAYIENREIKSPNSNNWEIKIQIHEKSTKEQRNQNQPKPMRNQPKNREIKTTHIHKKSTKEHTKKSKSTHTHEKSNQITHKEIKTQNTNHNPKLQKSNSTNKSTNTRFMRRKGIEH